MFSTPWHIGQRQFLPHRTAWTKNWTTSKQHPNTVNFLPGPSTSGTTGSSNPNNIPITPPTPPITTTPETKPKPRLPLLFPTYQTLVKSSKKVCKNKGIQVHFKGCNTLRTALGNPKDKDPKANQTGIIYHYQCPHINCSSTYIGESGRTLGDRIKEHLKAPSPIHQHSSTTGHPMDPNQFNIIHKEVNSQPRTIKEAMFICMQDPPLNQNLGKYQLPHIWDHLLQASPTLQCKPTNLPVNITSN